jgi:hypothetical protein
VAFTVLPETAFGSIALVLERSRATLGLDVGDIAFVVVLVGLGLQLVRVAIAMVANSKKHLLFILLMD